MKLFLLKKFQKISCHPHFLPLILFIFIFTIYFSSSVGFYNSLDTPQYFTTEALMHHSNLNVSPYSNDPHYFVFPDIFYYKGQTLNVRGYLLSIIMIPIHLFSGLIQNVYNTNNFPSEVSSVKNFNYELAITSTFTLFSALGLLLVWITILDIIANKYIASILTVFLGLGSYIWKYSSAYSRSGALVFLLSVIIYSFWKYHSSKYKLRWILLFFSCWALSYGLEPALFVSLSFYLITYLLYFLFNTYLYKQQVHRKQVMQILDALLVGGVILIIQLQLNYYWYDNFLSLQISQWYPLKSILKDQANFALLSTPLYPTILDVLFGIGRLNPKDFINIESNQKIFELITNLNYVKSYNFFGIFIISPYLFFSILSVINVFKRTNQTKLVLFCFLLFIVSIVSNIKKLDFWGGNQYDIRYFYPYIILLGIPAAIAIKNSYNIFSDKIYKSIVMIILGFAGIFSLFMGWLGVINMYKPSLTGERKIWLDLLTFSKDFNKHSFQEYLDATFMNRANFWIPIALTLIGYFSFVLSKKLFQRYNKRLITIFKHHL